MPKPSWVVTGTVPSAREGTLECSQQLPTRFLLRPMQCWNLPRPHQLCSPTHSGCAQTLIQPPAPCPADPTPTGGPHPSLAVPLPMAFLGSSPHSGAGHTHSHRRLCGSLNPDEVAGRASPCHFFPNSTYLKTKNPTGESWKQFGV